jgi:hypothetical protein
MKCGYSTKAKPCHGICWILAAPRRPARRPPVRYVPWGVGVGASHRESGVHRLSGRVGAGGRADERRGRAALVKEIAALKGDAYHWLSGAEYAALRRRLENAHAAAEAALVEAAGEDRRGTVEKCPGRRQT